MTILDELYESVKHLLGEGNPGMSEKDLTETSAKIIYYVFAKFNNFENILKGFRQEINTLYGDKFVEHIKTNLPEVEEQILATTPEQFDKWFEQF